ncbi:hypothetical protein AALO_G00155770 [Alosa alosa]|uniref:Uncharacterized protein n=1 Tax=Alosa alosa TaxID=278164 RepID=A0AAV6GFF7_9TELE|nr:uncharacterized protein LOC125303768 isoform X1 [Alosa alosa]KAG5273808.1 hypothetical protein AALO_G00155770 [Alosa alosa]
MEKDRVKHSTDDHYGPTTTTGQPKSLAGHWEHGEKHPHSEHLQTERTSDQLLKISAAPPATPTNDAKSTSEPAVSAAAICHKVKVGRSRKLLKPRKVSNEETQAEGNPTISQGVLVSRLKPPTSSRHTLPCKEIKRTGRSAVPLIQIPSKTGKGKTCGHLQRKRVAPCNWTSPNNGTPILFQPESPSIHSVISERKKSVPQSKDDKAIKIPPALPEPTHPLASSQTTPSTTGQPETTEEPLLIHGLTLEEYRGVYHSVIDPMLLTASGNSRRYSLELGRIIKQRLWERLFCPQLHEEVQADGRVKITETFCHPALFQHPPLVELDVSDEPAPEHAERKQPRPGTHKRGGNTSEFLMGYNL